MTFRRNRLRPLVVKNKKVTKTYTANRYDCNKKIAIYVNEILDC